MAQELDPRVLICNDETLPVPRQPNGRSFYFHCVGGFRAGEAKKDLWMIEPVMENGIACRKGFLTRAQLSALVRSIHLAPIAFQDISWRDGNYYSTWSPLVPGRKNHMLGPSDLWSNVASNLGRNRPAESQEPIVWTPDEIAKLVDDRTDEEWLAQSISLSLRSMDISVEQIAEFYYEQLTNLMAGGLEEGRRSGSNRDQTLFAHVHSFFLQLGAARDYLASLIAFRIGKNPRKIDSMARLIDAVRSKDVGAEALLGLLEARNFIEPDPLDANKRSIGGWLKQVSDLRNQFVHRRPYGARHAEQFGFVKAIAQDQGLYRYVRPVLLENDQEQDVLDVIVAHYKKATALFHDAAEATGWDTSMPTLTDEEIISIEKC